jgi:hypothetical protein
MQHRQESYVDGNARDLNTDCVFEYEPARVHSRCHVPNADSERLYAYQVTAPGRMRVTPVDPATQTAGKATSEIEYRIDADWLITTQRYDASLAAKGKQPERITTLWIRSAAERACKPRGESGLRVGRLSVSSLAFSSVPAGWRPLLVDPNNDKSLGAAVNRNFFVGAFSDLTGRRLVLVLDDFRYGPRPIREAEFAEVRRRFASELGTGRLTCDLPDRACAILRDERQLVYTELHNLRGRVAVIHATAPTPGPEAEAELRAATQVFVDQLRRENP